MDQKRATLCIDEGIHSFAISNSRRQFAVGTRGILGLYEVRQVGEELRFSHQASFFLPEKQEYAFTDISFSEDDQRLDVVCEDGTKRKLSLERKLRGLLIEMTCQQSGDSWP